MMKLITRFILSLCILLSSGYNQLYAHAFAEGSDYVPSSSVLKAQDIQTGANFSEHIHILAPKSGNSLKIDATDIEEEEEDFLISFKKYVENSLYFSAIFCTQILGILTEYIKPSLFLTKHFSKISPYRIHLENQVFTI
ncbi:hypothetical protein [Algoriphagus machipongonensis]|uniref:Cell wall surface anchor family protein n=1 Tax=Algoriphagus machipongonensis TaxID=388413 RepID=A3HWZ2_9BACT|nr:hypothetical protein [Algoriphagus machipongonensis]EAZ81115.1 putative cell wall surface anchor family protein [Algoriphagus machipongonensis]